MSGIAGRVSTSSQVQNLYLQEVALTKHCESINEFISDRYFGVGNVWSQDWLNPLKNLAKNVKEVGDDSIWFCTTLRAWKRKNYVEYKNSPDMILDNDGLDDLKEHILGLEPKFLCRGSFKEEHNFQAKLNPTSHRKDFDERREGNAKA